MALESAIITSYLWMPSVHVYQERSLLPSWVVALGSP